MADLRLRLEEEDIIANGVLDKLIRENLITSHMATSLINDSAYAYSIQDHIFDAAEIIFANIISKEKDLSLTDEELDKRLLGKREELVSRLREEGHRIDVLSHHGDSADAGEKSPDTS
jgi:phosphate:Na+ symporter